MTAATVDGRFDMGRVVQRTFAVTGRDFLPLFLIALIPIGVLIPVGAIVGVVLVMSGFHPAGVAGVFAFLPLFIVAGLAILVVAVSVSAFTQSALAYRIVSDLNGTRASIRESFSAARSVWLRVVGVFLLVILAFIVAFAMLGGLFALARVLGFQIVGMALLIALAIIIGFLAACVWTVVIPAQVIERRDVFASFDRSAGLTRGSRWRILLLILVFIIAYSIVRLLLIGVTAVLGPLGTLVTLLVSVVMTLFGAVLTTCIYYELRTIKEGVAPQALAQVFA